MPLFTNVASPDDGAIAGDRWELCARARTPVGRCQDCGSPLLALPTVWAHQVPHRDLECTRGHRRSFSGPRYKGPVVTDPHLALPDYERIEHRKLADHEDTP